MPRFNFGPATDGTVPTHLSTDPQQVRRALSTKEGWQDFVTNTPVKPVHLTPDRMADLSDARRAEYNHRRQQFHRALVLAHHNQLETIWDKWDSVVTGADADAGPGSGIALTGGPGYGKTALTVGYLRLYEREMRQQHPAAFKQENEFIPVCYSSLLRGGGEKAQMKHLAAFYNLPMPRQATGPDLRRLLLDAMAACNTKILCLDQAQNLRAGDRSDDAVAASVKELMDSSRVVIILIGINIDETGPLAPGNTANRQRNNDREQLARRFQLTRMAPLERGSQEWVELLTTIEDQFVLARARPGDLSQALAETIWQRTDGAIGVAYNLLRIAANKAIADGTERITATTLANIAPTVDFSTRRGGRRP